MRTLTLCRIPFVGAWDDRAARKLVSHLDPKRMLVRIAMLSKREILIYKEWGFFSGLEGRMKEG